MGQSRRLDALLRARIRIAIPASNARRYSEFVKAATNASNKSQIYISRSLDPYLNLSIENYLLQKTPENSTVLFLYTNRECVVIGRNQNPWVETNLPWFRNNSVKRDLVRRRSGGGTVFHDEGNVNYSVICPTSYFHRDKHAEMVVQALHKLGVHKAMVNERHDIVLDGGDGNSKPLKVSGSAYKLTRLRSLHHGTCLLDSPNIENISNVLFSPARPFIKARGVDSVKSAVANVHRSNESFEEAVVSEFRKLYNGGQPITVHESLEKVPEIAKGFEELKSPEWIYGQTPPFTFSTHEIEDESAEDVRKRKSLKETLPAAHKIPKHFSAKLTVRHGNITEADFKFGGSVPDADEERISKAAINKTLHEIEDWEGILDARHYSAVQWLDTMLGTHNRALAGEDIKG